MLDLNKTITIMKASKLDTKQFEDQQATITTAIENNNQQIQPVEPKRLTIQTQAIHYLSKTRIPIL